MCVTLEDFKAYRKINVDAEQLSKQIKALKKKNKQMTSEKVRGSSAKFPYTQKSFYVSGIINNSREIKKKEAKLAELRAQIVILGAKLEGFLKTVEDNEIRETLILYYIDGVTYREIPGLLGTEGDGSTQYKKIKRYFEKISTRSTNQ